MSISLGPYPHVDDTLKKGTLLYDMSPTAELWLANHPLFGALATCPLNTAVLAAYVEAFAPVVNSVPAFLHVTLSRADGRAALLLREIWNDELGLSGTKSHPVLFDDLHKVVTAKYGRNIDVQTLGVTAACHMVQLCSSGPWPIGVAAMKAHESQFPASYASILDNMQSIAGTAAEFFKVHSSADVEHTNAGTVLLEHAVAESIVTKDDIEEAFSASTGILRKLMDGIWCTIAATKSKAEGI